MECIAEHFREQKIQRTFKCEFRILYFTLEIVFSCIFLCMFIIISKLKDQIFPPLSYMTLKYCSNKFLIISQQWVKVLIDPEYFSEDNVLYFGLWHFLFIILQVPWQVTLIHLPVIRVFDAPEDSILRVGSQSIDTIINPCSTCYIFLFLFLSLFFYSFNWNLLELIILDIIEINTFKTISNCCLATNQHKRILNIVLTFRIEPLET